MFLNDDLVLEEGRMFFVPNPVKFVLNRLMETGSLLITCLQLGYDIEEIERWYQLGQNSDPEYKNFYNKVNNIEQMFGFEVIKNDGNPTFTADKFVHLPPFEFNSIDLYSLLYIQQNRKQYQVTNVFKSHGSNEIFLSINQEFSDDVLIPKSSLRMYDFTVIELFDILANVEGDTKIYVLKDGKAYAFGLLLQYENDFQNKLIIDIDMLEEDSEYNKIRIQNNDFINLSDFDKEDVIEELKSENIIIDGFFEFRNFYYKGRNKNVESFLVELLESKVYNY